MKIDWQRYSELAFKSRDEIRAVQRQLLTEHMSLCRSRSPFYRQSKFASMDAAADPFDILARLPFTSKDDIERDNDALLAVEPEKIVDIVMSSGTTGMATKVMYTESDLERLAYNERKSFAGCNISNRDTALLTCTLDRCFIAGLAYFVGLRALGAATIRNGHGSMESHLQMIRLHRPTVIVGVPTFIRKLGLYLQQAGFDPAAAGVKALVCIGEPLRTGDLLPTRVAADIERIWSAQAYSTYASSETVTTFCECEQRCGGHLHPDLAVVEVVDDGGVVLPAGEIGEVVVTPLQVEGMPLVRFRTGDVGFIIDEPCRCGRKSLRLGPILGRKKQMLKIRGTTVYPQAIFNALAEIDGVNDYYVRVSRIDDLSDAVEVHASVTDAGLTADELALRLQARIRVRPGVVIESDDALRKVVYTSGSRKPVRFLDARKSVAGAQ